MAEQSAMSTRSKSLTIRDHRRIFQPTEIPTAFQTGYRRYNAERPATVGAQRQRELIERGFAADSSSYFPKIHENHNSREFREQRAKKNAGRQQSAGTRVLPRHRRMSSQANRQREADLHRFHREQDAKGLSSILTTLDREGIEMLHEAFEELNQLNEEEFISEMLLALRANERSEAHKVELTGQLSDLFRQADLRAEGVLNWDDFSLFLSQMSDSASALEDTVVNKYQADRTPTPINLTAEVKNLFYFREVDQLLIQDEKCRGFQLHNVRSGKTSKTAPTAQRSGELVDAVYSHKGRYVITASSSPVISFYDIDHLRIRQQIPTDTVQTALTLGPGSTTMLYSACAQGQVHAWDMEHLERRHAYFTRSTDGNVMTDLEIIDSMGQLASACMDGKIYMVDLVTAKVTRTMAGHRKAVSMLRYCSENKYLLSAGVDHFLQVWNPHLEQKVGTLPGHRHQLIGMEVREDTPEVITADESGVIKIWDLRKFAAVQTIVKELYIKDHSTSLSRTTSSRPLRAMCYVASQERIAIAHSSVFFLDPVRANDRSDAADSSSTGRVGSIDPMPTTTTAEQDPDDDDKPLAIFYNPPTQTFLAITSRHIKCWDAATGSLVRTTPVAHVGSEVTCCCVMEDHYSCFVGGEDGTVARLMLPNAALVVSKRLHGVEVTALRCVPEFRAVLSCDLDGGILVSRWDSLEPLHVLNHWRGVQSVRALPVNTTTGGGGPSSNQLEHGDSNDYSVPAHLRSFFFGNEIERFKRVFRMADPDCTGTIPLAKLSLVLDAAFPVPGTTTTALRPTETHDPARTATIAGKTDAKAVDARPLTFPMFLEVLKEALGKRPEQGQRLGWSLADVSCLDADGPSGTMLSASSTDGTFCAWNLKNGSVVAHGTSSPSSDPTEPRPRPISRVAFLSPHPYFVCVEEDSNRLSIWTTVAMPPVIRHTYQCLVRFAHRTRPEAPGLDGKPRVGGGGSSGSGAFLTETHLPAAVDDADVPMASPSSPRRRGGGPSRETIRAIEWFYSEREDKKLLLIGDDDGAVTVYDFKSVLRRMDEVKRHRTLQRNLSTLTRAFNLNKAAARSPRGANNTAIPHTQTMFPELDLQRLHRWSTSTPPGEPSGASGSPIRHLRAVEIENLVQPNANKRVVVMALTENGAISLWSIDGAPLGRLQSSSSSAPRGWKLRLDNEELKQRHQENAATILKSVEQRLSIVPTPPPGLGSEHPRDGSRERSPSRHRSIRAHASVLRDGGAIPLSSTTTSAMGTDPRASLQRSQLLSLVPGSAMPPSEDTLMPLLRRPPPLKTAAPAFARSRRAAFAVQTTSAAVMMTTTPEVPPDSDG